MNHTKKQSQLWQHYPALKQSRYQDLNEHFGITLRNNRNWGSTIPTLTKSRRLGFLFSILLTVLSFWDLLSILLYLKKKNNLHKEESLQSFQNISWLFCSIFQFLNQLYQQEVSSVAFICSLLVRKLMLNSYLLATSKTISELVLKASRQLPLSRRKVKSCFLSSDGLQCFDCVNTPMTECKKVICAEGEICVAQNIFSVFGSKYLCSFSFNQTKLHFYFQNCAS